MNAMVNKKTTAAENDVIDISISVANRKKIRIDGDDNRIILLNPSDTGIAIRVAKAVPELEALDKEARECFESSDESEDSAKSLADFANRFEKINNEMCRLMDYIFDADVSTAALADGGTMYDLHGGYMQYEIIFNALKGVYDKALNAEITAVQKRVKAHTEKYGK